MPLLRLPLPNCHHPHQIYHRRQRPTPSNIHSQVREPEKKSRAAPTDSEAKTNLKNQPTITEAFQRANSPVKKNVTPGPGQSAGEGPTDKWASLGQGCVLGAGEGPGAACPAASAAAACSSCAAGAIHLPHGQGKEESPQRPRQQPPTSSIDEDDGGDDDELPCPVCDKLVALGKMNLHLDSCLGGPEDEQHRATQFDAALAASLAAEQSLADAEGSSTGPRRTSHDRPPPPLAAAPSTVIVVSDSDDDDEEEKVGLRGHGRVQDHSEDEDLPAALLPRPAKLPKTVP